MSIMIREDAAKPNSLEVIWNYKEKVNVSESATSNDPISPDSIMTEYEAIHVGITRNYTEYTEQGIKSSIPTWTSPYLRPLIMHHNETDGKIIGRIHHAEYSDKKTLSGTGALILTGNIPDKEGKEAVQDGRLKTVSIGAIVHECFCSICGQNIAEEGVCEHERGNIYDGKLCTWQITNMEAKELSYVIVPSDIYAQHTKIYSPKVNNKPNVSESYKGVKTLEPNVKENEQPIIDETVKDSQEPVATENKELETKVAELKADKEKLEEELKVIKKQLEDEKKLRGLAEKELSDTQVLLTKANEDIEKVKKDLTAKESALQKEIQLREAAEALVVDAKKAKRIQTIESIIELRGQLNKRLMTKEDLTAKSDEYLQESLADLQDELQFKESQQPNEEPVQVTEKVTNPGIVDEEDENKKSTDVKEHKQASNINVEEQLESFMSSLFNTRKY